MDTTIDSVEAKKFNHSMEEWWDENGKFKTLHQINPLRLRYIRDNVISHYGGVNKFDQLRILDIGCGGGLLAEPMARMGGIVTGIDVNQSNINSARNHASIDGLKINYLCSAVEELRADKFDIILCFEVVEHVQNLPLFIKACANLLKRDGLIFFSTINRTLKSYALAIIGAEYILRWVPIGTHSWQKFIQPSELEQYMSSVGLEWQNARGMTFSPFKAKWQLDEKDLAVNYLCCAVKINSR